MTLDSSFLYTDSDRLAAALAAHEREPIHSALAFLSAASGDTLRQQPAPTRQDKNATVAVVKRALSADEQMLADATAFAVLADAAAGQRATHHLLTSGYGRREAHGQGSALRELVSALQTADLLRQEATFGRDATDWYSATRQHFDRLATHHSDKLADTAWLSTATLVIGVLEKNAALVDQGISGLIPVINTIHPEGYLRPTLENSDPQQAFMCMADVVGALVLGAEAAQQAGQALWTYENRGVSINTAAAYLVSHYFYPQKWRWGGPLDSASVTNVLVRDGAFLEMVGLRHPLRATTLLLDDLRPLFSLHYGGLTTLTHGLTREDAPRKRRFPWG